MLLLLLFLSFFSFYWHFGHLLDFSVYLRHNFVEVRLVLARLVPHFNVVIGDQVLFNQCNGLRSSMQHILAPEELDEIVGSLAVAKLGKLLHRTVYWSFVNLERLKMKLESLLVEVIILFSLKLILQFQGIYSVSDQFLEPLQRLDHVHGQDVLPD